MNATAARPTQRYRCSCQRVFEVFGGGRRRRFYELDDPRRERPVMARVRPFWRRALPTTPGLPALELQP